MSKNIILDRSGRKYIFALEGLNEEAVELAKSISENYRSIII